MVSENKNVAVELCAFLNLLAIVTMRSDQFYQEPKAQGKKALRDFSLGSKRNSVPSLWPCSERGAGPSPPEVQVPPYLKARAAQRALLPPHCQAGTNCGCEWGQSSAGQAPRSWQTKASPCSIENIQQSLCSHFIKYIPAAGGRLLVLLAAQSGVWISDLDGKLRCSLHNHLAVL